MKATFIDVLKETQKRKRKYFENYRTYGSKIKAEAEKILGQTDVFVFGSIVKNQWGPKSDIDILIISEKLPQNWIERRNIRTNIKLKIDSFTPFQIHLVTPKEYNNWYKKFIKDDYEEIK